MSRVDAVVFDLDDTLYCERLYAFSGFDAVAQAHQALLGDPIQAARDMRTLFDTEHRSRVFDALLASRNRANDLPFVPSMVSTFRQHSPKIDLYPDADRCLSRLRGRVRLGVLSDGPAVSQNAKVLALDLRNRVDEVLLTDELGPGLGKPHPRGFQILADRLGAVRLAYVADNVAKDFVAPNVLGWLSILIDRPEGIYRDGLPAQGGMPCHRIDTLDGLDSLIEG